MPRVGLDSLALDPGQWEDLNRLGPVQEVYTPDPLSRRRNARILWLGVALGLILWLFIPVLLKSGDPEILPVVVFFALFGGFFVVACGWRLRQLNRGARGGVFVCAEGLAYFDGKRLVGGRWEEVETIQGVVKSYVVNGARAGSRFLITVQFKDGKALVLDAARDHLANMDALYYHLCTESARHLLPRLYAAVEAGETVAFGHLGMSKAGLQWGKHFLPWGDRESIDYQNGLRLRSKTGLLVHPWIRVADMPIPNHHVFVLLVEYYLGQHGRYPGTEPGPADHAASPPPG